MRYASKSSNLYVVLRPGLPAQPITGAPPTPTIAVRFIDGLADVKDDALNEMMQRHPGFSRDFIVIEDIQKDPYGYGRQDAEPGHVLTEMNYGMPGKRVATKQKTQLPPEMQKLVQEMAIEIAKGMLPGAIEEALKSARTTAPVEAVEEGSGTQEAEIVDPKPQVKKPAKVVEKPA